MSWLETKVIKLNINSQVDVVTARQKGREMACKLGFSTADQTRLATAISELTRNVIQYAGNGTCVISDESNHQMIKVQVTVEDHGPGIPNIDKALEYGYTTGNGLGAGLPGARKLVSHFMIESSPGYTCVVISISMKRT